VHLQIPDAQRQDALGTATPTQNVSSSYTSLIATFAFLLRCLGATNADAVICSAYSPNRTHRGLFWPWGIVPTIPYHLGQILCGRNGLGRILTRYCFGLEAVPKAGLILQEARQRMLASVKDIHSKLTSYGSFFLVAKDGTEPSFCVSAQWKISWYSLGLSSCVGMLNRGIAYC
jgi:hypothetical protein